MADQTGPLIPHPLVQKLKKHDHKGVKEGGRILENSPKIFPDRRKAKDLPWAALFLIVAVATPAVACVYFHTLKTMVKSEESTGFKDLSHELQAILLHGVKHLLVGAGCSFVSAFVFAYLLLIVMEKRTRAVVYGSLLGAPALLLLIAVVLPFFFHTTAVTIMCCILGLFSFIQISLVFFCWKRFIDFTVEVLKHVCEAVEFHPGLFIIAIAGSVASAVWMLVSGTLAFLVQQRFQALTRACDKQNLLPTEHEACQPSSGVNCLLYFVAAVIFYWGALVFHNITHVTNVGVVGRWFFQVEEIVKDGKSVPKIEVSVGKSFCVALTTSFGTICLGSLVIAIVHAVESTLAMLRAKAEAKDNPVLHIIIACLECIVGCVKDLSEAFSYLAFVQVSLRGLNFIDSVKATMALCTYGNVFKLISCTVAGSVVHFASVLCGAASGFVGFMVSYWTKIPGIPDLDSNGNIVKVVHLPKDVVHDLDLISLATGIVLGVWVSTCVFGVLQSGFATICVCLAEGEKQLKQTHNGLYTTLTEKRDEIVKR